MTQRDNPRVLAAWLFAAALVFAVTAPALHCRWVWVDGKAHWVCDQEARP